jgi:glycosyltransferase involved in cell wall biosynthesis
MLFSVIIPTYNREKIIADAIRSVLAQDFRDFEIIVVDDGSTDNTAEVTGAIGDQRIMYYYKENAERSVARNFGADMSTGEYLIFLDSDDRMEPGHLQQVAEFINRHNNTPEFMVTGYTVTGAGGKPLLYFSERGIFDSEKLIYGNYLSCSPVIIKSEIFKKYCFNTDRRLILFEDWELWLRVIAIYELHCLPGLTISIINHSGRSVLNSGHGKLSEKILFLRDYILEHHPFVYNRKRNRRIFLSGVYSYAALHIAMTKANRALAIRYLFKTFTIRPSIILKRRLYGILKHLI